nr:peptidoglycan editing factor PgeF [Marinibactrum halimedae]
MVPEWPLPAGVKSVVTNRKGGVSVAPWDAFNLADHVGDSELALQNNRSRLQAHMGEAVSIQWLKQVHGTAMIEASADDTVRTADAAFTQESNLACAVLTADCLPVLLCNESGTEIAAIHAGWRGLAKGILRQSIDSLSSSAESLMVFLGPCIGQESFEVGVEVMEVFFESATSDQHLSSIAKAFKPSATPLHFYGDLIALARAELAELGISKIYGGDICTYKNTNFYSYRREKETGRFISAIWIER